MIYSVGPDRTTPASQIRLDKHDIAYVKQSAVAFQGACRVEAAADDFFGGERSKSCRSRVMVDPTWRQLFGAAKTAAKHTNDRHHCFFEGASVARIDTEPDGTKVAVLRLWLGS